MANIDPKMYVDTSALAEYSKRMSKLNGEAIEILDNFRNDIDNLDGYWTGKCATGFKGSLDQFKSVAKSKHEKMGDLEQFLMDLIVELENL